MPNEEITSANDCSLIIKAESDSTIDSDDVAGTAKDSSGSTVKGVLIVDDFEVSASKDDTVVSGVGNKNPQARARGNREFTFDFTLQGENSKQFDTFLQEDTTLEVILEGQVYRWKLTGLDYEDFTFSGSDGDVVEFSSSMSALTMYRDNLTDSDDSFTKV